MQPFLPACAGIALEGNAVVPIPSEKNRDNSRAFFEFGLEIVDFCPKSAKFSSRQGN